MVEGRREKGVRGSATQTPEEKSWMGGGSFVLSESESSLSISAL